MHSTMSGGLIRALRSYRSDQVLNECSPAPELELAVSELCLLSAARSACRPGRTPLLTVLLALPVLPFEGAALELCKA